MIFKNDEGMLIADVHNDLTEDVLAVIEVDTEYIADLAQGSQYTFMLQVWIGETTNGGLLVAEPSAVENE